MADETLPVPDASEVTLTAPEPVPDAEFVPFKKLFPTKEEPSELEKVLSESEKVLKEYGYLESNIPIGHYYWKIRP